MKKYLKTLAQSGSQGFTLIELLIVMIIIGLLSALVAPRMFKKVGTSRIQAVKAQISLFETALDTYRLDNQRYPSSSEGLSALVSSPGGSSGFWDGPYLKKIPKDPWGSDYIYSCESEDSFVISSKGADGQENTEDDISNANEGEGGAESGGAVDFGGSN